MGCDFVPSIGRVRCTCFNPRTRMGCDCMNDGMGNITDWFQSAHPHGVRLSSSTVIRPILSFNPRTRMGCDICDALREKDMLGFNPRTRMGCDTW